MIWAKNLGFPRMGAKRELKFALERYWSGRVEKLFWRGNELFKAGKLDEATDRFREAVIVSSATDQPWMAPWVLSHAAKLLRPLNLGRNKGLLTYKQIEQEAYIGQQNGQSIETAKCLIGTVKMLMETA